ncbi:PREDICTED: alpha-1-antitrypsin-like [Ceratotherium simum simum]|uniref:Alpha-1-antitrypsin-like n=1 Tax=Ceratotherium simum simum TaxID=73337 RepID=A0ABM0HUK4_CERSS|nr:PREDICTED: alpha-1-antitrypsin-like [Ceratotherium simum simum]
MPSSITWGLLLLAGLCCLVPGTLQASEHDQNLRQHPPLPNITPNLADLDFSLYHELARESYTTNIFFSPVSITIAFAILSLGTKGATHIQIPQGLNFNFKETVQTDIHKGLQHLLDSLNQPGDELQLTTSNILLIDENLKQVHKFLEDVRKLYHSQAFSINFGNIEEAKKEINKFIEKGIQGKMVDLVNELDNDTSLALVNYIFFHGKWKDKFEAGHLMEEDFQVDKKTTVKVLTINCLGLFDVRRIDVLSSCVLLQHYQGKVTAFLIMPDPGKMQQLEDMLSEKHLFNILRLIDRRFANLRLPKLSISGTYDLIKVLGNLGITKVFSNQADLLGITEEAALVVSKALHMAALTIDENGSEASGNTPLRDSGWYRHLTIRFDRPLLVIVKDESTNIPLFMGKVMNPTQK